MKDLKYYFAIIFLLLSMFFSLPFYVYGNNYLNNDYEYYLEDNIATLTAYRGNEVNVIVPNTIDGYKVVKLEKTFMNNSIIETVTIDDGIENIGSFAFTDCKKLSNIDMPDSVIKIENFAFAGCASLKKIDLPDNLQDIGAWSFAESSLEKITIPFSVRVVGEAAFIDCSNLKKLNIESDALKVYPKAFKGTAVEVIKFHQNICEYYDDSFPNNSRFANNIAVELLGDKFELITKTLLKPIIDSINISINLVFVMIFVVAFTLLFLLIILCGKIRNFYNLHFNKSCKKYINTEYTFVMNNFSKGSNNNTIFYFIPKKNRFLKIFSKVLIFIISVAILFTYILSPISRYISKNMKWGGDIIVLLQVVLILFAVAILIVFSNEIKRIYQKLFTKFNLKNRVRIKKVK